jgi:hypothetical protein
VTLQTCAMHRAFAMPSAETFSILPIREFVMRWLGGVSVDPFARDSLLAKLRNDINPTTKAQCHMDAEAFCAALFSYGVKADVGLFDPPYSPRQISECYKSVGLAVGREETQNARLYRRVRGALDALIKPGGMVLSFGWHSNGMGLERGYEIVEILLVAHGGAHNDTICLAERKMARDTLAR